eukprot:2322011-Rhodomonas_salina.1
MDAVVLRDKNKNKTKSTTVGILSRADGNLFPGDSEVKSGSENRHVINLIRAGAKLDSDLTQYCSKQSGSLEGWGHCCKLCDISPNPFRGKAPTVYFQRSDRRKMIRKHKKIHTVTLRLTAMG